MSPTLATGRDDTASIPIVIGFSVVERKSCDESAAGTEVVVVALDVLMARAAEGDETAKTLADARRAVTAAPVALREASGRIAVVAIVLVTDESLTKQRSNDDDGCGGHRFHRSRLTMTDVLQSVPLSL